MSNRKLLVDSKRQVAILLVNNDLKKEYQISTASNGLGCEEGSFCTPIGKLRIAKKIGDGLPTGTIIRSRVITSEVWSSDITNPVSKSKEDLVLTRLLWLEGAENQNANTIDRYIYLHGTNQETLLGTPASHGCVRFSNFDIIEIYKLLHVGDEVEIV